jgi:hypothetical protein
LGVDSIDLAQEREKWRAVVNRVMWAVVNRVKWAVVNRVMWAVVNRVMVLRVA